jgi:hypothetical protein
MPDLSCPKYIGGKLYCWDRSNKEIVEIQIAPVNLARCDKQIIAAFVDDGSRLGEDGDGFTRR